MGLRPWLRLIAIFITLHGHTYSTMVKKVMTMVIMLLANTILLVHAVIPHHHHADNDICFVASHCHSGAPATDNCCTHQHQHHSGSEENCVLNQVVATPHNVNKFDGKCPVAADTQFDYFLSNDSDCQAEPFQVVSNQTGWPLPFIRHDFRLTDSSGLRAPPAV